MRARAILQRPRARETDTRTRTKPGTRPQAPPSPFDLLALQRTAGNAAVASLVRSVQRSCGCGGGCGTCGGSDGGQPTVQRGFIDHLLGDAEEFLEKHPELRPDPAKACKAMPFPLALMLRNQFRPQFVALMTAKFGARVGGLWALYISGGTAPLTFAPGSSMASEFASSTTTAEVTQVLAGEVAAAMALAPPSFPVGVNQVDVPASDAVSGAQRAWLDSDSGMDFSNITEVPGNIAGGIGKDQAANPVGAMPSPFDDSREVDGFVRVVRGTGGDLTLETHFTYTVKDTVDICPGNLGALVEQQLTIPLSRLEASGVAGDVPFTVVFPGPTVTKPVPGGTPPKPPAKLAEGTVTASSLRIRAAPSVSAPIVGDLVRGDTVEILCQTTGSKVLGTSKWNKVAGGYVSDAYISRKTSPATC